MEWTVLEAEAHVEYMKNNLADGDVYLSTESCEAIHYLIEQAKRAPTEDEWRVLDGVLKTFTRESSDELACLTIDAYRERLNP